MSHAAAPAQQLRNALAASAEPRILVNGASHEHRLMHAMTEKRRSRLRESESINMRKGSSQKTARHFPGVAFHL